MDEYAEYFLRNERLKGQMKINNPLEKVENPIDIEQELCLKCGQHLVAKNTLTGEQICTNENCKNYNAEFMKRAFTVSTINPLLKQNEK